MFPFHFHFQLSKDVRTRLEISKYWIPWICCVVVLRSMKVNRLMLMSLSRSQGLFILGERRWVIYLSFFLTISIWFHRRGIFDSVSQFCFIIWKTFRFRKGDQQAPPSIRRHPSNERIPPAPPLADILNNRLFEEILFGNFSLFHLHSKYHNVTLLPLVTSVQNSLSATYKWNK